MPYVHDPRDERGVDIDAVNAKPSYTLHVVLKNTTVLPDDDEYRRELATDALEAMRATGATVRGCYDVGGFRADADLMVWLVAEKAETLQAAYHALLGSQLGLALDPVWSVVGVHRPAEFNSRHIPACLGGVQPRPWIAVYPFVRSLDWYTMDAEKRREMLREHGMNGNEFPDVKVSTLSTFALSDYEWILSFEADDLHRLTDVMHHQRKVEARLHVKLDTPFFTGSLVELTEWADRQPRG